jgi:hypothetical protein
VGDDSVAEFVVDGVVDVDAFYGDADLSGIRMVLGEVKG